MTSFIILHLVIPFFILALKNAFTRGQKRWYDIIIDYRLDLREESLMRTSGVLYADIFPAITVWHWNYGKISQKICRLSGKSEVRLTGRFCRSVRPVTEIHRISRFPVLREIRTFIDLDILCKENLLKKRNVSHLTGAQARNTLIMEPCMYHAMHCCIKHMPVL